MRIGMRGAAIMLACLLATAGGARAAGPAPDDDLNAVLWSQTAVEAAGNAVAIYALGQIRLDQALADKGWTAAPVEQTGAFADKPPAVILDVDDTVLDTSRYQAWNVIAGTSFTPQSWTDYVRAQLDTAIPGAVAFAHYAASRGVTVFYVTNRTLEEQPPTVEEMKRLGFPFRDDVQTFLPAKGQPDWGSAKGTRRAVIARDYRILLMFGDNLGDFTDAYKGTLAERRQVFEAARAHWGRDWLVVANPTYGSFESAPYGADYKLPAEERRRLKEQALDGWSGK